MRVLLFLREGGGVVNKPWLCLYVCVVVTSVSFSLLPHAIHE